MNYKKAKSYNTGQTYDNADLALIAKVMGRDVSAWTEADHAHIKAWQKSRRLQADGALGPATMREIRALVAPRKRVPLCISEARTIFAVAAAMLFFIDVSTHQRIDSWAQVAESCDGVIIKSGQGESGGDEDCERNVKGARAAGVKVLALYHYAQHFGHTEALKSRPSCPKKNAINLATACKAHGVKWGILDLEPEEVRLAIEQGWTAADFEAWTRAFVAEFSRFKGLRLAVYLSGETVKRSRVGAKVGGFDWLKDSGLPLWWAGYLDHDDTRPLEWGPPVGHLAGWPLDAAHQYRGGGDKKTKEDEGGKCPGIRGDVDNNCAPRNGWAGEMWRDAA